MKKLLSVIILSLLVLVGCTNNTVVDVNKPTEFKLNSKTYTFS